MAATITTQKATKNTTPRDLQAWVPSFDWPEYTRADWCQTEATFQNEIMKYSIIASNVSKWHDGL